MRGNGLIWLKKHIELISATSQTDSGLPFNDGGSSSFIEYPHAIALVAIGVALLCLMFLTCWWYFMLRIRAKREAVNSHSDQ